MRILHVTAPVEAPNAGCVAGLGNFDGVHRGHAALFDEARQFAERLGAPLAAAVFEPHPRAFFARDDRPFLLTSLPQKARLLGALGIETVFAIPFDRELAALSPEAFVRECLIGHLRLRGVAVGAEFCFGKGRAGDAHALKRLCEADGCAVEIVTPVLAPGADEKFSSTQARAALREGDPRRAAQILGHDWVVEGVVSEGDRRGRTIGFPTANISTGDLIQPKYGVYAVRAKPEGSERWYDGVANFGMRPTVGGAAPRLEVNLFEFDGDLYGKTLQTAFVDFIRAETKFSGLDALKAQIALDAESARSILAAASAV
ncbi:MAG: bifunctional riboflavin kinase/FAD synthetase [Pseudomonadota bacterium]